VTPPRPSMTTTALAALILVSIARAESVPTKDRARLRQGPSAATDALGDVDPGTRVELLGESAGWRQVRTPDGRVGYIWGEHLALEPKTPTPTAAPRTLADEVHDLRDEVNALRQRPEPATAADLARLGQEVERLATAEREIARRLEERIVPTPADPPPESIATLAPALLAVGAAIGFVASRLLQGRHDRRQRNRLRL
jgi:uncharacterized protein YgiM (DUF1202 family)